MTKALHKTVDDVEIIARLLQLFHSSRGARIPVRGYFSADIRDFSRIRIRYGWYRFGNCTDTDTDRWAPGADSIWIRIKNSIRAPLIEQYNYANNDDRTGLCINYCTS